MLRKIFSQPFFQDSKAMALAATGFIMLVFHSVYFLVNVESQEIKVPIRYSGYDASLNDKGHWITLFSLFIFGILIYVVNIAISVKVYGLRKALSIWTLTLNIIIMLFLILISKALLNLV